MRKLAKTLITATALSMLPLSLAYAGGSTSGSQILNGQVNFNASVSALSLDSYSVKGDVTGQSVAGANAIDITTMNDTKVVNNQYNKSTTIDSSINAGVGNISGSVGLQSQAFCNSANVSTDPTLTKVNSTQQCDAVDPSSTLNTNVAHIGGDVGLASSAVANTFEADSNATNMPVQTSQINNSFVQSRVNANVSNVGGSVAATSAAIGNNAQIIHYTTN